MITIIIMNLWLKICFISNFLATVHDFFKNTQILMFYNLEPYSEISIMW